MAIRRVAGTGRSPNPDGRKITRRRVGTQSPGLGMVLTPAGLMAACAGGGDTAVLSSSSHWSLFLSLGLAWLMWLQVNTDSFSFD